jgi:hypothetical protein
MEEDISEETRLISAVQQYGYTVKELREKLEDLPDDAYVILEKDAEGNGYSPLASIVSPRYYEPDSTWSGSILEADDAEAFEVLWDDSVMLGEKRFDSDTWENYIKDSVKCVVLGPVN